MTLYDTEALTKLAVATFTRSGDLAIRQYYKTLAAYNSGLLGGAAGPLKKLLNLRDELGKVDLEADFAAMHDALLPSQIELSIIFRKMAGQLTAPKKRGRGNSNWEQAAVLLSETITVAIADGVRLQLAFPWFLKAVEDRMEAAGERHEDAEERGWESKYGQYKEEFDHVFEFEAPTTLVPETSSMMDYLNGLPEDEVLQTLQIY